MTSHAAPGLDATVVRLLRRRVGEQLSEQKQRYARAGTPLTGVADEKQLAQTLIAEAVTDHAATQLAEHAIVIDTDVQHDLRRAVFAGMFQAGGLQRFLDDDTVENVNIIGADRVFLKFADGRKERGAPAAADDDALVDMVRRMAEHQGLTSRPWDPTNPFLRLRLDDGSRLAAIGWVCARPTVSIRRNRYPRIRLDDLFANRTCTRQVADFLAAAVRARLTIAVAGDQAVGKTTLLRALIREIPATERIFTVEASLELDVEALGAHDDVVALEARSAYGDQLGEVTLTDLVRETLIQDASRVIVGECRGPEIIALLNATLGGSGGSMTTVHAKTPRGVFNRIANFAAQAEERLSAETAHMLAAEALELVVFLRAVRDPDGTRRRVISDVLQVDGYDRIVQASTVFGWDQVTGQAEPTEAQPSMLDALVDAGYRPDYPYRDLALPARNGWGAG